jgi:hypothetical protein
VILPRLDLIPYCEPLLIQDLVIEGGLKDVPILTDILLFNSTVNVPSVLITIIPEYVVTPAQYSLYAIIVNDPKTGDNDGDEADYVIIKKHNAISNEDEWWLISGINESDSLRVNPEDIFTNDVVNMPIGDYPSPLPRAIMLRYELITSIDRIHRLHRDL